MSAPPFQPSESHVPVAPPPDAVPHYIYPEAGTGKRFLNFLINLIAANGVIIVYSVAVAYLSTLLPPAKILVEGILATLIIYTLYVGYFFVMELTTGRTLGKLITNTRVVNEADIDASWKQILGRTAARFIPFEPFSFLGGRASGWHDTLSKTKLIDTKKPPNVLMSSQSIKRPFDPAAGQPTTKA